MSDQNEDEKGSESETTDDDMIVVPEKAPSRHRVYPVNATGPFVVYFRPIDKRLNIVSISRTLSASFEGVKTVTQVTKDKLRVVVETRETANKIVASEHFTLEYRVYIRSHEVEIDGVISDMGLTPQELLEIEGEGRPMGMFKNSVVKPVGILDCKPLYAASVEGGVKTFKESGQLRVTFEGSALPDYLVVENVRLPVRLFVPRVMNCQKCHRLGHTKAYCGNKARCTKCGGEHEDQSCEAVPVNCIYCLNDDPHDLGTCPMYTLRKEKLKRSLQQRSKRTFAEILKKANPSPPPQTINAHGGIYHLLPSDEVVPDDPNAGFPPLGQGNPRKRANPSSSPNLPRKRDRNTQGGMNQQQENAAKKPKQIPPGFTASQYDRGSPQIPGTSKTPDVSVSNSNSKPSSGFFSLNQIVNWILSVIELPDSQRAFIVGLIPFVKSILIQVSSNWPIIATFIRFDD